MALDGRQKGRLRMPTVDEILASIGEHPGRLVTLPELLAVLKKAGFPTSRPNIHKHQMAGTGPAHFIYGNRAIYRVEDAIQWAVSRARPGRAQEPVAVAA
jgi:hypothetical protein